MLINAMETGSLAEVSVQGENNAVRRQDRDVGQGLIPRAPYFESTIDDELPVHWWRLTANCPPKFTVGLVAELRGFQDLFARRMQKLIESGETEDVPRYHVLTSDIEGVFNLGGDLSYFYRSIRSGDREGLARYARDCVELVYRNASAFGLPMTTIALVKGNALGGGMEAALSAEVIVVERHVQMGLPEVLFNMFPGMGAYQFLSRRMAPAAAERFILSGKLYAAEELLQLGVVDHVVDTGGGEDFVRRLVRRERNHERASLAFRRAVREQHPVRRDELMRFVEHWIEAAMRLDERDLGHMRYLIRSQSARGW